MEDDMFPRTEDDTSVTVLKRRAALRRLISTWIRIWLICAFLACTPLLHAYAEFRAVKGGAFFKTFNPSWDSTPLNAYCIIKKSS